jgi:hypothetical protein
MYYSVRGCEVFNHGMAGFMTTCASEFSVYSLCSNSNEPVSDDIRWSAARPCSGTPWLRSRPLCALRHAAYHCATSGVCVTRRLVRVGGHERSPNQLEELFRDLGPMPPAEDCDDRAMWVAAMINPLPALGVAYEIRPAVLTAQSPTTRLQVVSPRLT